MTGQSGGLHWRAETPEELGQGHQQLGACLEQGEKTASCGPGSTACLAAWGEAGAASSTGAALGQEAGSPLRIKLGSGRGFSSDTGGMDCGQEVGQPLSARVKERKPEPQTANHVAKARCPFLGISTPGYHILDHSWEHVGNLSVPTIPGSPPHG